MPTVLVDNTGQSTGGTSTTSLSISSFAVGSGANRFIDLTVSQYATTDQVPSATFNGSENFVVHDAATIGEGAGTRRVTKLRLVNPSNATAAIAVSWGGTVNEAVIGATSWTEVNQTTPFGTAVKNTSNNASSSTVNVTGAVGDVISDGYSGDGDNPAKTTSNQTQRWRNIAGAFTTEGQSATAAGTGSAVAMTVTTNIGNIVLAHIGVAIQQAASAAVVTAPLLAIAIRPVGKGRIGPLANAMRMLRAPQANATGAIFSDAVAESLTAVDSETATADFAVTRAETLAAADTETATAVFAVARAETLTASDAQTGAMVAAVDRAESLTAADSQTGTLTASTAVSESLSAAESATGALVAAVTRAESLAATDSQDATVTPAGASTRNEVLAATDTQTATVIYAVSVVEALSVADVQALIEAIDVGRGVLTATGEGRYPMSVRGTATDVLTGPAPRVPMVRKGPP